MQIFRNKISFNIGNNGYILAVLMLLLLPLRWIAAWLLASVVHEFFHYLIIKAFRIPVLAVRITPQGVYIATAPMPYYAEFLASIAGPVGALSLLFLAKWLPVTAICAYCQSLYHLLPVFPLDGGRAFKSLTMMLMPEPTAAAISRGVSAAVLFIIAVLGIYCSFFLHLGPLPLLAGIFLPIKCGYVKIPCKDRFQAVQ